MAHEKKIKSVDPSALPDALMPLVRHLDQLHRRATPVELNAWLLECQVSQADLKGCADFDDRHYRRTRLAHSTWYELSVICWRPGQCSPVHSHAGTVSVFKVLTGICTETVYAFSESGRIAASHTFDHRPGETVTAADTDTHRIANLQPPGQDLITVYVFSPPLKAMHTYSPFGDVVLTGRPEDLIGGEPTGV